MRGMSVAEKRLTTRSHRSVSGEQDMLTKRADDRAQSPSGTQRVERGAWQVGPWCQRAQTRRADAKRDGPSEGERDGPPGTILPK
jgi:hypothetical protein